MVSWQQHNWDKAMQLGFRNSFVVATYIYCTKHVRNDIALKLSQLKVSNKDQRLQNDIFGDHKLRSKGWLTASQLLIFDCLKQELAN